MRSNTCSGCDNWPTGPDVVDALSTCRSPKLAVLPRSCVYCVSREPVTARTPRDAQPRVTVQYVRFCGTEFFRSSVVILDPSAEQKGVIGPEGNQDQRPNYQRDCSPRLRVEREWSRGWSHLRGKCGSTNEKARCRVDQTRKVISVVDGLCEWYERGWILHDKL